jgi:hypothetical protein
MLASCGLRLAILGAALGLLAACSLREPLPHRESIASSSAYAAALNEATRRGDAKVGLDIESRLTATLISPVFFQALEQEFDRVYGASFTAPELVSENLLIVVALGSTNRELLRGRAHQRLWRLTYQPDGVAAELEPVLVTPYPREDTFFRTFFPYWNPWRRMYRVEFPVPATAASGTLHMRGVSGELQLTW